MARRKGAPTGRCRGCNHPERVRIERFLAAGASIKGAARKFDIDYHALRRHWTNHVSADARASYVPGVGATQPGNSSTPSCSGTRPAHGGTATAAKTRAGRPIEAGQGRGRGVVSP